MSLWGSGSRNQEPEVRKAHPCLWWRLMWRLERCWGQVHPFHALDNWKRHCEQGLSLLQAKVVTSPWSGCKKPNWKQNEAMAFPLPALLPLCLFPGLEFCQSRCQWMDGVAGKIHVDWWSQSHPPPPLSPSCTIKKQHYSLERCCES